MRRRSVSEDHAERERDTGPHAHQRPLQRFRNVFCLLLTEATFESVCRDIATHRLLSVDVEPRRRDQHPEFLWFDAFRPTCVVEIDIQQFEQTADGTVRLVALWAVRESPGKAPIAVREASVSEPAALGDTSAATHATAPLIDHRSRDDRADCIDRRSRS